MSTVNPFSYTHLVRVEEAWLLGILSEAMHHFRNSLTSELDDATERNQVVALTEKLCYANAAIEQLVTEHVDNHL